MRTPSPTFCDELKTYQRHRLSLLTPGNDRHSKLTHKVVNRWKKHPDRETIWTAVRPLLRVELTPSGFIDEVVLSRIDAEELTIIVSEAAKLEKKTVTRTIRQSREKKYFQAVAELTLLGKFKEQRARVLGREKTGPRVWFMKRWSALLLQWCGKPLDDVVRVITEIAFGEPISTDAVKHARSGARRDRRTRPPK